jgi:hypothetical protein
LCSNAQSISSQKRIVLARSYLKNSSFLILPNRLKCGIIEGVNQMLKSAVKVKVVWDEARERPPKLDGVDFTRVYNTLVATD